MDQAPEYVIVLVGTELALISSYATRIVARSHYASSIVSEQNIGALIVGALMMPAVGALLVWGFVVLAWYWVIGIFSVCALLLVPLAFGGLGVPAFLFWWRMKPLLDLFVVGLAVFVWVDYSEMIDVL